MSVRGKILYKKAGYRSVCDECGGYIEGDQTIRVTWIDSDTVQWQHATHDECGNVGTRV